MDGNLRRLPPWMLAGSSSDVGDKIKQKSEAPKAKPEKRPRRNVKPRERDDSDESKNVKIRRRGEQVRSKIPEVIESMDDSNESKSKKVKSRRRGEQVRSKTPETIESVPAPETDDFTVDDLLSFAHEYVKGEEDQIRKDRESLSISESMVVVDESCQGETKEPNGTTDPTADGMLATMKDSDELLEMKKNVRATEFISQRRTANESISAHKK